ncbi:LytR/AlgR family response regulator transcription factor [Ulvibacter litoralis]|uniref:LytR/AlgR family response regulator transcription factor n=1 Tax=Ulvibacter litoralis TaxID=227084 RepID=UPI0011130D2C|nr:LytTR family DNA-binding domain-containing protein [Ulvibacter litoralis]
MVLINFESLSEAPFVLIDTITKYFGLAPHYIGISRCYKMAYTALKKGFKDMLVLTDSAYSLKEVLKRYDLAYAPKLLYCIHSYYDYRYVVLDHLVYLKADNYTTELYMKDGTVITDFKTLKCVLSQLPGHFQRIHRSYVVNSHYVRRIQYGRKVFYIRTNDTPLPFSKTYLNSLRTIRSTLSALCSSQSSPFNRSL